MKKTSSFFWSKLALKELLNNRRFSIFFLFNLALGLAGFIALDSFKDSLDNHLGKNSQAILGADLALTSYVPIDDKTIETLLNGCTSIKEEEREEIINSEPWKLK